ncbi:MAG: hypothetical protein PHX38_06605 [Sulfuricella sp.]|nr:hypothetical protein [Sulfuricella sp.]
MKNKKTLCLLLGLGGIAALSGCAEVTPYWDQHFGETVNLAKAQQTVNPDASRNTDPVAGLDGQSGKAAIDRYHQTFQNPPPPVNVFNIGIGSGR